MPLPNPDMFGPSTLVLGQAIGAFSTFLPKFSEVRAAHPSSNSDVVADVRMGEVAATALTVGVGAIASSLTGSPAPMIVGILTAFILVGLYEAALNADPNAGKPVPHTVIVNSRKEVVRG
jgi:hypothetical protein